MHVLPQGGLLVHSLDLSQKMALIISVVDENTKALTARSVLKASAILVPTDEAELFDPSQLRTGRAIEIKRTPINEDVALNLI